MLVLFGCSESDGGRENGPDDGKVAVSFIVPGIRVDVAPAESVASTRAVATEPFGEGVTVRVAAFRRAGTDAALASDTFVDDGTYMAVKEGGEIVLKPCTIGTDGAGTLDEAGRLRLAAGTYDFYAITPALPLRSDNRSVEVGHGADYASSPTFAVQVERQPSGTAQSVELNFLERKCSKLNFAISRRHPNVDKAVFNSVKLGRIAAAPATPMLSEAIALGANTGEYTFPNGTFAELNETTNYLSGGFDEVLPKNTGAFDLSMNVTFNDGDPTDLTAEVPALRFDPGYQYNFNLKLIGNLIELELVVMPWTDVPVWDTEFGNPTVSITITVGSWEIAGWETTIGGSHSPVIAPDSWTTNPEWSTDFGEGLPSLIFTPSDWAEQSWKTDFGEDHPSVIFGPTDWPEQSWETGFDGKKTH